MRPEDLPALRALQSSLAPIHRAWSEASARDELLDFGRGGGANVALAFDGPALAGFVGWVSFAAAQGDFYGAPFVAASDEAASLLLDRVQSEARAHGAAWLRISAFPEEQPKIRALQRAGFRQVLEFIDLVCGLREAPPPALPMPGLSPIGLDRVDGALFADLNNTCFRGVANAPEITAPMALELWRSETVAREGSQLWADQAGRYQAFLLLRLDGTVDSLGVRPGAQRRGLARRMLERAAQAAHAAGLLRLRSVIASDNEASLKLHRAFGFTDFERRQVWQLGLLPA
ncbi:MAG: GNAT family N-acetyltransferase [Myxococcaceae bacterium]